MYNPKSLQYYKIHAILLDIVIDQLRIVFKREWNALNPQKPWQDDQSSLQNLRNKEMTGPNWKANKSRLPKSGDCTEWDLTNLFFGLLFSQALDLKSRDPGLYKHVDTLRQII